MNVSIESRLAQIEERNHRVELDKAWETSWARRLFLTFMTYLLLGLYMWMIEITRPWLNSIIPAAGFFISTLTIEWAKKRWIAAKS